MSKCLYKYVEYNCFLDKVFDVKYFAVNNILDIESEILKFKGLAPKENTLMITPDMDDKNKWHFHWEAKSSLGISNFSQLSYGYIEKIDSDAEV